MTSSEKQFMKIAIEEAQKGMKIEGGPFGACVVFKGQVIAKAHNRVLKTHNPCAHAEILAIEKAGRKLGTHKLEGCELYITTMPCAMCASAIHWARINVVYYGTSVADAKEFGFNEIDEKFSQSILSKITTESTMREECYQLFIEYDKQKGKRY